MTSSKWISLAVVLACVAGCTQKRDKPKATPVGQTIDMSKTQYTEVDLAKTSEIDLVEDLHAVRADYRRLLEILQAWYLQHGYHDKAKWAQRELKDLQEIRTHNYLHPVAVQVLPEEGPTEEIVKANELFDQAQTLRKEGEIAPLINDKAKLKESLALYREIVREYPKSTKAPDAAYYAAELLKEHFEENLQAIEYYRIALKLKPDLRRKARFQLAVIYDLRLHDRAEALKWYRKVLSEEEGIDRTNTSFATNRIKQLTEQGQATQPGGREGPK